MAKRKRKERKPKNDMKEYELNEVFVDEEDLAAEEDRFIGKVLRHGTKGRRL